MIKTKFFFGNIQVPVKKCNRPSFKNINGRSWDHGYLNVNGIKTEAWLDTTWGQFIYFVHKDSWHKVKMYSTGVAEFEGKGYDIDPFASPISSLETRMSNV